MCPVPTVPDTVSRVSDVTVSRHDPDPPAEPDGRSTRWHQHRRQRHRDLCRSARRAVHHQGPDLSMDEMAAAMGTSKSIVVRYFSDKSGMPVSVEYCGCTVY